MNREELVSIAAEHRAYLDGFSHHVLVCAGLGCPDNERLLSAFRRIVAERQLEKQVLVRKAGCMGLCALGPLVLVQPEEVLYQHVQPDDAEEIITALGKEPLQRLLIPQDLPFFSRQYKNVLALSGRIDPESIGDYLASDGYNALLTVLTTMQPADIIDYIKKSGLRGRGGAGYPTGEKWSSVAQASGTEKYLICNGDEGDPGAFMDRSILESTPHAVLEGMVIAAYAVGVRQGCLYIRAEYPLAVKRIRKALVDAEHHQLLGSHICGTDFDFFLDVRLGAGAFVCGEETALIASVEGCRGIPRTRPPYPAVKGVWGYPTLINNVETYANVAPIIRKGPDWFSSLGTEKSKGTKVFALAGKVCHAGLIEVPMGTTLREIIFDIGGGVAQGHVCKAAQTGGPSGGCIPEQYFDTPVSYESLRALGSIMGSGGMIVIDETSNIVDVVTYFMEFCKEESCGQCAPCRCGTVQMHRLLTRFQQRCATAADLSLLEELCDLVKETSLCGLGRSAPNPVLSSLRYFRQEYLDCLSASGAVRAGCYEG
ncbi:MAG: NADH-ubiquinone oxidoreductase-F iron-sulfur binding region domain-containing protein [Desulfobulbus sp.]|nr:NADH-ubiquinone oxidoreductase-F iron-sulfur binding region domain-containing protein [Desulfobulbus sp.]